MSFAPLPPLGQRDIGLGEREDIYERPMDDTFGALRRAQQSYLDVIEQRWRQRLYGRLNVPVGIRQPPVVSQSVAQQSLPSVVQQATSPQARSVLRQIARPQATPGQAVLPITKDGANNMDLGNILGAVNQAVDIYGRYRGYRDPGGAIMAQPVIGNLAAGAVSRGLQALRGAAPMLGGLGTGAAGGMLGEFLGPETIPMADFGTDCVKPSDVVYMWDEKLGTYVPKKKRKRRRKQLITQSDIKGLAALKGVVGTGKIMETWIATHC